MKNYGSLLQCERDEVVKNNEILQNDPSVCHPERSVAESNAERDT